MAISLFVIATESGVPLFSRKSETKESLQFASIAALHGLQVFSKHHNTSLLTTWSRNGQIAWKEIKRVTLIGISTGNNCYLDDLLSKIYEAMILFVGQKNLEENYSMEQIKKEIRLCHSIIDLLVQSSEFSPISSSKPTFANDLIESILCPQCQQLQNVLEVYTKKTGGRWASLLVHGRVTAVSKDWSTIHPNEAHLLNLISVQGGAPLREHILYLPYTSPDVPFRAIICKLLSDVYVSVVCGSTPSLTQIDEIVLQTWESSTQILKEAKLCFPRNLPQDLEFEIGVLGVLLIDIASRRCFLSGGYQGSGFQSEDVQSSLRKLEILKSFYVRIVRKWTYDYSIDDYGCNKPIVDEAYWCLEYHKCHAKKQDGLVGCVLYACTVPTHTMRLITTQIISNFNSVFDQLSI